MHLLAETDHSWVAGVQANVYLGTRGGDCAGSTMLRLNVLVVVRAECITTSRITSKSQMCGQSCGQSMTAVQYARRVAESLAPFRTMRTTYGGRNMPPCMYMMR